MMKLAPYRKKRNFKKTPEPKGGGKKNDSPIFVVQKHDASHLHYDLRLEVNGVLVSFAIPKGPSLNPKDKRLAMQTEDHPLDYADFEGTIPKGNYGAGEVIVWDRGTYDVEEKSGRETEALAQQGLQKGSLKFELKGVKLKGKFALAKMKTKENNTWLLIKKKDKYASDSDITKKTVSVFSGKTLRRDSVFPVGNDDFPKNIAPMLATLANKPFDREGWLFEEKYDGYRILAEKQNGTVKLLTRNRKNFSEQYKEIRYELEKIPHAFILDGEVVAYTDGRENFQALQNIGQHTAKLHYHIFDILYLDGHDLRKAPLKERRRILEALVHMPEKFFSISNCIKKFGKELFREMQKNGREGIIAKSANSTYQDGKRSPHWQKIKTHKRQEAVIGGYTVPRGSRNYFGSLVLGIFNEDGKLQYVGHAGGGFDQQTLKETFEKLRTIERKTSPFAEDIKTNTPVTWVTPKLLAEVKFSEWTREGHMRQPVFLGLRNDKDPKTVRKEQVNAISCSTKKSGRKTSTKVDFTNLEKVFWPDEGYTKGDVVAYYENIADLLLPYFKDRPQNLLRHPDGISKKGFFQKNMETEHLPEFVETVKIYSKSNKKMIDYLLCQNTETLLYLAQMGSIEMNPWNSRVKTLEKPDYMIFDIDPGTRGFDDVIDVSKAVHAVLGESCQVSYPKTSGKRGIHIVVPLNAKYDYAQVREFARLMMVVVNARLPELTSLERNPKKRDGKVYLDFLQNRLGQTLASAYSLRPWPKATVSTPLEWSEVKKGLRPEKFTIRTIFKRIEQKGDLWKPVIGKGVDLKKAIRCLEDNTGFKDGI